MVAQVINHKDPNSVDNANLLAIYEATDNYSNLEKIVGAFTSEFLELQNEETTFSVNGVNKKARIFSFGDYEWLCKTLGHMGPSSSFPCLWCYCPLQALRDPHGEAHSPKVWSDDDQDWVDNDNWYSRRTVEELNQDLIDLLAHGEGRRPVTGTDHNSISKKPILPLRNDLDHLIPPCLHIELGLTVRYFKLLEEECRKQDFGSLEERHIELFNKWQDASVSVEEARLELDETEKSFQKETDLLRAFKMSKEGKMGEGLEDRPCSLPLCALQVTSPSSVDAHDVKWLRCTACGRGNEKGWFHCHCLGITDQEYNDNNFLAKFVCPLCQGEVDGPADVLKLQSERVAAQKQAITAAKNEFNSKKKKLDSIYSDICKSRGPSEKRLNEILENDLKVKRQAYHSQCFVGNHCIIIMKRAHELCAVIANVEKRQLLETLFDKLAHIFKYFESKFLSDGEIKDLCHSCYELGNWFPTHFPDESIPPKLHFLICHVPECAVRWKIWVCSLSRD